MGLQHLYWQWSLHKPRVSLDKLSRDNANPRNRTSIYDNALVSIGDNVLIGPGVCICTTTHATDVKGRQEAQGTSYSLPIRIEADCWIGARVTILPGVTIGRGSTVAAGAVVHKDVEPETLVGGVPARFIRSLKDVPKDPEVESIDDDL
jgi:acetyltransferase-like isoleucine patch superfamily enzyme